MMTNKFPPLEASYIRYEDIDQPFIGQWRDLESRTVEDNAYLSPSFVIPALKHLSPQSDIYILTIMGADKKLYGLGIFRYCKGDKHFPLPYMEAYRSIHSYLSGLLIDKSAPEQIISTLFTFIKSARPKIFGLRFTEFRSEGELNAGLQQHVSNKNSGIKWHETNRKLRAYLTIRGPGTDENWGAHLSKSRRKGYRRAMKGLGAQGEVSWQLFQGAEADQKQMDTFLHLEHGGWKQGNNSSLLSKTDHQAFFIEMMGEFINDQRAFFFELSVNDHVIASTCNLLAGQVGFAFKLGWDEKFQEHSPGIINEMEFLRNIDTTKFPVHELDSGAEEGSFINSYWPERKELVEGFYLFGTTALLVMKLFTYCRQFKRFLRQKSDLAT